VLVKIRVERVWKDVVKAFPKGLYAAENNVVGLLGYQVKRILSSERGACPVLYSLLLITRQSAAADLPRM